MKEELIEQENKLYGSTKDFGRIQFIREIIKLQQENAQLKQQLKDKDEKISKAIDYCNEKLKWNRDDGNDYWAGKNNAEQQVSSDIKDILESNKED